jgi:hypothetical protein
MTKHNRKLHVVNIEAEQVPFVSHSNSAALPVPKRETMEILPLHDTQTDPVTPHASDELFSASMQGLLHLQSEKQRERTRARWKWLLSWLLILYALGAIAYYGLRNLPWQQWLAPVWEKLQKLPIIGDL